MTNEEAIDVLMDLWRSERSDKYTEAEIRQALNMGMDALKHEQRWIPLSERFPEDGQKVLCQCQAEIVDVFTRSKSVGWIEDDTNAYMPLFVVAWMPLPEPYKAESEE